MRPCSESRLRWQRLGNRTSQTSICPPESGSAGELACQTPPPGLRELQLGLRLVVALAQDLELLLKGRHLLREGACGVCGCTGVFEPSSAEVQGLYRHHLGIRVRQCVWVRVERKLLGLGVGGGRTAALLALGLRVCTTYLSWSCVWYYSVQYRRVQGGVARGATLLSTKRTAAAWASVRQMQKCKFGQGALSQNTTGMQ